MKWKLWTLMLSSLVLVNGCVAPTNECVWTESIYFENSEVIDYLLKNDYDLLELVISHNEKRAEFCGP